jgi:hypothetical protein
MRFRKAGLVYDYGQLGPLDLFSSWGGASGHTVLVRADVLVLTVLDVLRTRGSILFSKPDGGCRVC